jgi:hypothetical protein
MIAKTLPKFSLGQMVATPGALEALQRAGQSATEFLQRHAKGDWAISAKRTGGRAVGRFS